MEAIDKIGHAFSNEKNMHNAIFYKGIIQIA